MRVISGKFKGRRLKTLRGLQLRPTSDRLKETLFNVLAPRIANSLFLDCFAGSGSIGLEALSRGARKVIFIENNPRAIAVLKENLKACGEKDSYEVITASVPRALEKLDAQGSKFDIIFLDPPYDSPLYDATLKLLGGLSLLNSDGVVIVEHHRKRMLSDEYGALRCFRQLRQGDSVLSFYALAAPS